MKLSLIVPCYNEERRIYDCLDAVLRCGYPFHEIIVIDNGSTDYTADIVRAGFSDARVVSEPKVGLPHARQRGFQEATGDVLVYIDADTRMPKGWTERVAAEMRDESVAAVSGPCTYYDASRLTQWLVRWCWWNTISRGIYAIKRYMLMGSGFAIRRSVVEAMGGIPLVVAPTLWRSARKIDFMGEDSAIAKAAHKFGKCRFLFDLEMPASARRLQQGGLIRTVLMYATNYLSPGITKAHTDYR